MSLNHSLMFFLFGVIISLFVVLGFALNNYLERRRKEKRELAEAAKMFEQRIALKPKHMGARHTSVGAVPVDFGGEDTHVERE